MVLREKGAKTPRVLRMGAHQSHVWTLGENAHGQLGFEEQKSGAAAAGGGGAAAAGGVGGGGGE